VRPPRDYSHIKDETVPLEDVSTADAAWQSAERAASMPPAASTPRAADPALDMFGRVDSLPVPPAQAAAAPATPVRAPQATAEASADLPVVGFSDAPPAEAARPAPSAVAAVPEPAAVRSAVKTLPPPAVQMAPSPAVIADPVEARQASAPVPTHELVEPATEHAPAEPDAAASSAGSGSEELSDAVLSALADELRKFPEVEWACQLDDADKPVIGIRVDPSYLQRSRDIEASVIGAAKSAGAAIVPLIVSTPAATKDARARGRMFFPWKKKK